MDSDQADAKKVVFDIPTGPEGELVEWWVRMAYADAVRTVPKAAEYGGTSKRKGSADLRVIGDNLAELLEWEDVSDAVKQELGAFLYAQGKLGRLISDYQVKRPGKADTVFDAMVYLVMIRRLQDTGNWP